MPLGAGMAAWYERMPKASSGSESTACSVFIVNSVPCLRPSVVRVVSNNWSAYLQIIRVALSAMQHCIIILWTAAAVHTVMRKQGRDDAPGSGSGKSAAPWPMAVLFTCFTYIYGSMVLVASSKRGARWLAELHPGIGL